MPPRLRRSVARKEPDPIDTVLRIMRRRADVLALAVLGLLLLLALPLWLVASPPEPYALAGVSVLFVFPVALFAVSRWGMRRMRVALDRIRPRIRDVGIGSFRGMVLVTDDHLFIQSLGTTTILSTFFASDGATCSPTARDGLRWTGPLRWTRETFIRSPGRGSGAAANELSEIRTSCGAIFARADVLRYSARNPDPDPPSRMATVALSRFFSAPSFEWIVANTARVAAYLTGLAATPPDGPRG